MGVMGRGLGAQWGAYFHMQGIFFPVQSERQAGLRAPSEISRAGLSLGLRGHRQAAEMSVLQNFLPHAELHPSLGIRNPGELWGLSSPCPSVGRVTVLSRTCHTRGHSLWGLWGHQGH